MKLSPCPHWAVTRSRAVAVLAGTSCAAAVMATAGQRGQPRNGAPLGACASGGYGTAALWQSARPGP